MWKPAAYIGIPASFAYFIFNVINGIIPSDAIIFFIGTGLIIIIIAIICGFLEIFGGADSIALSIIALTSFHVQTNGIGIFSIVYIQNLLFFGVLSILFVFIKNIKDKNYSGLGLHDIPLLFTATKMDFESFELYDGAIMEKIYVNKSGELIRKMLDKSDYIKKNEYNTRFIYEHANENVKKILTAAGGIWVTYLLPMIVPITCAYIFTMIFGDFTVLFGLFHGA